MAKNINLSYIKLHGNQRLYLVKQTRVQETESNGQSGSKSRETQHITGIFWIIFVVLAEDDLLKLME